MSESKYHEQAVKDVASEIHESEYDVVNGLYDLDHGDFAARFAICQRERVLELEAALRSLLKVIPSHLSCEDFNHNKDDFHSYNENCKPFLRFETVRLEAEALLDLTQRKRRAIIPDTHLGAVEG